MDLLLFIFFAFLVPVSTLSQLWDSVSTSNCSSTYRSISSGYNID